MLIKTNVTVSSRARESNGHTKPCRNSIKNISFDCLALRLGCASVQHVLKKRRYKVQRARCAAVYQRAKNGASMLVKRKLW